MKNDSTPSEGWCSEMLGLPVCERGPECPEWHGICPEKLEPFIKDLLAKARQDERREIIEFVKSNTEGTFTDDAGNDCWYIDDLIKYLEE